MLGRLGFSLDDEWTGGESWAAGGAYLTHTPPPGGRNRMERLSMTRWLMAGRSGGGPPAPGQGHMAPAALSGSASTTPS